VCLQVNDFKHWLVRRFGALCKLEPGYSDNTSQG
jgi:hypothetical protein